MWIQGVVYIAVTRKISFDQMKVCFTCVCNTSQNVNTQLTHTSVTISPFHLSPVDSQSSCLLLELKTRFVGEESFPPLVEIPLYTPFTQDQMATFKCTRTKHPKAKTEFRGLMLF